MIVATATPVVPDGTDRAKWERRGAQLGSSHHADQWAIGDWVNYWKANFDVDYPEAMAITGLANKTLRNYAWVARNVQKSLRRDGVDFGHHEAVASLWPEEQDAILSEVRGRITAGDPQSVARTRQMVRAVRAPDRSPHDPFTPIFTTVLDARAGEWQEQRRWWRNRGLDTDVPALSTTYGAMPLIDADEPSMSRFDPVLAEVLCAWYSTPGGIVLDPFAGGAVRGVVAGELGRRYVGVDIRGDVVEANRRQAAQIDPVVMPTWIAGDAADVLGDDLGDPASLILTCPPYFDLERYSDDPADLSTMSPEEFVIAYRDILTKAADHVDDGYAAIVAGNVRAGDGHLRNLGAITADAMTGTGFAFWNEHILATPTGSAGIRVAKQYASRKAIKAHQTVYVFRKGKPRLQRQAR
jgi:hypothetical protein